MGRIQKLVGKSLKFPEYDHKRSLGLLKSDIPANWLRTNKLEVFSVFRRHFITK